MAKSNKSKWIMGLSGAALSAFVIAQVGSGQNQGTTAEKNPAPAASMSKQEQELVQLDWSNYSINGTAVAGGTTVTQSQQPQQQSDRQTKRS
jgi:hypothetical protein